MDDDKVHSLNSLSDYSLLHIFKYVSSTDLYNLSLTCRRFEVLVREKKLWYKIDSREGVNDMKKVTYCVDRINKRTTQFLVCSDKRDMKILPDNFFSSSACSKLTVLALENQLIRGDMVKLSEYPKSLVELSLRKSFVNSHSTFFKFSYMQMANLKVLILDECGWVETYMLVQMSKYSKLEILSLYKCKKLSDNDIAYLSLAGCYGFKQLRILDIRFTGLGDQILKIFYKHPKLQELYFQSYISTYALDKARRHLEIARGSPIKPRAYFSPYDDIQDTNLKSMHKLFGYHVYRTCRRQNLTNHGTVMYKFVIPNVEDEDEVQSVLYQSPYGKCSCGYGERDFEFNEKHKGVNREKIIKLKNIIKEEKYKKCSPHTYVLAPTLYMDPFKNKTDICFYDEQASESNKQIDWINMREPLNLYEMAMFEHTDVHSLHSNVALPVNVMSSLEFDGYRVPNISREPKTDAFAEDSLSDDGKDKVDMSEEFISLDDNAMNVKKTCANVSERLLSLDDGDVIVEELFGSPDETEGKHKKSKTSFEKGGSPGGARSDDKGETRARHQRKDEKKGRTKSSSYFKCGDDYITCDVCGGILPKPKETEKQKCEWCEASDNNEICSLADVVDFALSGNDDMPRTSEGDKILEIEPDLPSTSKTQTAYPSPSNASKRRHEAGSETGDVKKLRTNDDEAGPSGIQEYLNISFEIDNLNVGVRPSNMIYVSLNTLERLYYEPDLINVPIGDGLINILLGADNKTKVSIKKLSLRGFPKITDCTLEYLTSLKLDLLDITKTSITRAAVQNFMYKNPTCRVLHETACVCQPNMHF